MFRTIVVWIQWHSFIKLRCQVYTENEKLKITKISPLLKSKQNACAIRNVVNIAHDPSQAIGSDERESFVDQDKSGGLGVWWVRFSTTVVVFCFVVKLPTRV